MEDDFCKIKYLPPNDNITTILLRELDLLFEG